MEEVGIMAAELNNAHIASDNPVFYLALILRLRVSWNDKIVITDWTLLDIIFQ